MAAVKGLYNQAKEEFTKAGIDAPAFNSLCLIEKVFKIDRSRLMSESIIAKDEDAARFVTLVGRRLLGEPLQYILGEWEFYGYKFKVGRGVLIPRDDTEVLLRSCLDYLSDKKGAKVLDLCSGSGALAVVIAKERDCETVAVEKSAEALPYLMQNISLNKANVAVVANDIFRCVGEFPDNYFDLILSNPPYVISDEIEGLQREISFEPRMALDGGRDGYDFYRFITKEWKSKLKKGGRLAFELGEGQFETVKSLMEDEGFENIGFELDLGGIQRAVYGTLI
ncbi:MAG: peptide chain release factor N(5)-glutamine methyltransferase [Ruminococcus sp.]|nr:peptide chain release factor N(5)-glutamine methyltransferase [Ruminococcus sp.]